MKFKNLLMLILILIFSLPAVLQASAEKTSYRQQNFSLGSIPANFAPLASKNDTNNPFNSTNRGKTFLYLGIAGTAVGATGLLMLIPGIILYASGNIQSITGGNQETAASFMIAGTALNVIGVVLFLMGTPGAVLGFIFAYKYGGFKTAGNIKRVALRPIITPEKAGLSLAIAL